MSPKDTRLKDEGTKIQVVTAGAIAGMTSRFVTAPLDVVKIRLQLQTHSLTDPLSTRDIHGGPIYKGILPTIRHIKRTEGLSSLWKGNVPAELLYVCYAAVQFTTYRSATLLLHRLAGPDRADRLPQAAESFLAGASGGAAASAATYPLDLLRTRFAAQGNERVYPSLRRAVAAIYRDEGPRGYFRGLSTALAQIAPYMGVFFAAYESLRLPFARLEIPLAGGDAAAGVLASVLAKTCVFPLDLVRKRIQVQGPTRALYVHKNIPEYRGPAMALRTIFRTEGVRGLYRGLTVSLLKAAPASTVTVWTYERALNVMIGWEKKRNGEENETTI